MHRIYISGPTDPEIVWRKAFVEEAARLRAMNYQVESPAEISDFISSPQDRQRRCIGMLVTCDEICMLRGWRESRGAVIEREIAEKLGMVITGADG